MTARIAGPGFFRIMLALIVFQSHASRLDIGRAAVYIFFVLSGYWIAQMWGGRYSQTDRPYWVYLISRAWRLLPVFVLSSVMTWLLLLACNVPIPSEIDWAHQAISNIFILGYRSLAFQPNGSAWSLDTEVQFYIIAPIMISAISRSLWAVALFMLVSLAAGLLGDGVSAAPHLVFFAIGIAAAAHRWKPPVIHAISSLVVTIILIFGCVLSPLSSLLLVGNHAGYLAPYAEDANIAIAFLMVPWAIYTTTRTSDGWDKMFADLSYIIYLLHFPIMRAMQTGVGSYTERASRILATFALIVPTSIIVWLVYDRPINAMRANWVRRHKGQRPKVQ